MLIILICYRATLCAIYVYLFLRLIRCLLQCSRFKSGRGRYGITAAKVQSKKDIRKDEYAIFNYYSRI